jgi:hypothetical protein
MGYSAIELGLIRSDRNSVDKPITEQKYAVVLKLIVYTQTLNCEKTIISKVDAKHMRRIRSSGITNFSAMIPTRMNTANANAMDATCKNGYH